MFAPWFSVRTVEGFDKQHWAEVYEVQVGGLQPWHLAVVYGSQDVEENLENAGGLIHALEARGQVWIAMGVWNVEIDEMETRTRCLGWNARVVGTCSKDTTCFSKVEGNMMDYFITSVVMSDLVGSTKTMDTNLATHRVVVMELPDVVGSREVDIIKVSRGVAGRPMFGPKPKPVETSELGKLTEAVRQILVDVDRRQDKLTNQQELDCTWAAS